MEIAAEPATAESVLFVPGQLLVENHRLFVRCAEDTWLELLEVQLEGKKRLAVAEFLRGATLAANAQLG
jgi:methionyl-tRNA formyltransferase